jgi:uncharacterized protein (TIGR03435 family)
MLQHVLADRFQMVIHRETKESAVFDLVEAKGGHKLVEYVEESADPKKGGGKAGTKLRPGMVVVSARRGSSATGVESNGMSMAGLARELSRYVGKPVVDRTGMTARYNIKLHFDSEGLAGITERGALDPVPTATDPSGAPTLFEAVQEQLGLKLEQRKGTVEIIVIDKAERTPTSN